MADIGTTLREARIRARIDITEVEARTKIRAKYLRAIENEEWDLLPGPVYVKSFLRTYGDFLGRRQPDAGRRVQAPLRAPGRPGPAADQLARGRERERRRRRPRLGPVARDRARAGRGGRRAVRRRQPRAGNSTSTHDAADPRLAASTTSTSSTTGAHQHDPPSTTTTPPPPKPTTVTLKLVATSSRCTYAWRTAAARS